MADFAGFQIVTPDELNKARAETRRNIFASGNNQAIMNESANDFLRALFGDTEASKAEARTNAAKAAFSELDQRADEDDIDFRRRQTQAFFDKIKDVDPALAAQASEQLTVLQNERLERDALLSAERRRESNELRLAAQEEDRQTRARRANLFDNLGYAVDRRTGEIKTFDLSNAEGQAEFRRASQDPNQQMLTREELVSLDADKARSAETQVFNRSTFAKKLETYSATQDSVNRMDRIVSVLTELPDTLTTAAQLEKAVTNINQELGAASRAVGIELGGYQKDLERVRDRIAPAARARGVTEAMVLNLAYSLARALDPGGRLSDKDLELALDMIGGQNADPSQLARIALEQIELQTQKLSDSYDVLAVNPDFAGSSQGRSLTRAHEQLLSKRDRLRRRVRPFITQDEYDSILLGVPLPAQAPEAVTPNGPSTLAAQGGDDVITITIPGLE